MNLIIRFAAKKQRDRIVSKIANVAVFLGVDQSRFIRGLSVISYRKKIG
ncbi:hypothetical protein RUMHYD_00159 [Blautia hydrogenotrophica DSM 10507]|uniref:Uncharacterized protein n=1 Tax=Blautia hydrogenotrophica (strain DSM 10507 / JCM 14656 / S5a33) TaxID=476272 RepID=C0CH46_BLAHS|nr:hypothetical protein RUMHYD_00159 [Blautia hydrogenotrophica DSM 10507]